MDRQKTLQSKIQLFLSRIEKLPLQRIKSRSAIQNVIVPGNTDVKKLGSYLEENKFDCRPILSPTIKEGTERIRICLHAFNSDEEIKALTSALQNFVQ